jgi:hypothetical protein
MGMGRRWISAVRMGASLRPYRTRIHLRELGDRFEPPLCVKGGRSRPALSAGQLHLVISWDSLEHCHDPLTC